MTVIKIENYTIVFNGHETQTYKDDKPMGYFSDIRSAAKYVMRDMLGQESIKSLEVLVAAVNGLYNKIDNTFVGDKK